MKSLIIFSLLFSLLSADESYPTKVKPFEFISQTKGVKIAVHDISHFEGMHSVLITAHRSDIVGDPTLHLITNGKKMLKVRLSGILNKFGFINYEVELQKEALKDSYITFDLKSPIEGGKTTLVKKNLSLIEIVDLKELLPKISE